MPRPRSDRPIGKREVESPDGSGGGSCGVESLFSQNASPAPLPRTPKVRTPSPLNYGELSASMEAVHILKLHAAELEQLRKDHALLRDEFEDMRSHVFQQEANLAQSFADDTDLASKHLDLLSRLENVEQLLLGEDPMEPKISESMSSGPSRMKALAPDLGRGMTKSSPSPGEMTFAIKRYHPVSAKHFHEAHMLAGGPPELDAEIHEFYAQDVMYDFCDTVWDIMPFCGLGILSWLDLLSVVVVVMLNMVVQGGFIGLVIVTMLEHDFDDDSIVTEMEHWRVLYAHNPDFADSFTDRPLAEDICRRSFLRMEGASQASLYFDMDEYTDKFFGMPGGAMLCLLSVFLWLLTCGKECKRVCLFLIGIWTPNDETSKSLWHGAHSTSRVQIVDRPVIWLYGEMRQKNYQLYITPWRALSITTLVVLPRAIILGCLAIVGSLFLIKTLQPTELILNAVALDVIMNVDELLFDMFAPAAAARVVFKTMPLRVPRTKGLCRHAAPWIKMFAVFLMLIILTSGFLSPMVSIINDVKSVMCDGDLDFLAAQVVYGPIVAAKMTNTAVNRSSFKYRAIYQRTNLKQSASNGTLYVEGGVYAPTSLESKVLQIKRFRDRTIVEVAKLPDSDPQYVYCRDDWYVQKLPLSKPAMMLGVGSIVGNESIQSCADVAHLCFSDMTLAGQTARLVCPDTCGGGNPASGLHLDLLEDGVPKSCETPFSIHLWFAACEDSPLSFIVNSIVVKRYVDGFNAQLNQFFKSLCGTNETHCNVLRSTLMHGLMTEGCDLFKSPLQIHDPLGVPHYQFNLCDPLLIDLQFRRSLRPLCPVACKCNTSVRDHYHNMLDTSPEHVIIASECPKSCLQ